ncbi:Ferredoxin 7Fe [Candidatus Hydrogenisulfobacillus filiaventi]|uniref:Ferredoxin n=1 Tax=Candidatus Hydrogenisulfobacillus filiaventi TaxID=2707344 RepID=A0A6F8ZDX1_9FIRM|nr:ferredoxin family protein [Bacillota bacterium]CAB1127652.1 Ferredoxin 7Fe [Candidatus Hydrogenisulfobacillus filiaventi]
MAHIITAACIGTKDRSCVDACPVDCIHPYPEGDGQAAYDQAEQLYIDPDTCIDCGACVPVCPVSAIYPDDDLPADMEQFREINAAYYRNR